MATSGFLPGLFITTDCAKSEPAKKAQANAVTRLLIGLLLVLLVRLRGRLVLLLVVRFLLQPLRLLFRDLLTHLQVAPAIEDPLPLDERRLDARVGREGMAGPDHQVGVLADVDRADAVIEAQLLRAVERAELQRLLLGQAAVLH